MMDWLKDSPLPCGRWLIMLIYLLVQIVLVPYLAFHWLLGQFLLGVLRVLTAHVKHGGTDECMSFKYSYSGTGKKEIDLAGVDTSKVTDMSGLFFQSNSLETIKFGNIDTANVTDMANMFAICPRLSTLDLSRFVTGSVTDMHGMFSLCESLKSLDLSMFRTSSAENMRSMFENCEALEEIKLPYFDTSKVTNMKCMFRGCKNLERLDLSSFDTSKVTDMSQMFLGCCNLRSIGENTVIDMRSVKEYRGMFFICPELTGVKLRHVPEGFNYKKAGLLEWQFTIVEEDEPETGSISE